jgi:hypothetical protein
VSEAARVGLLVKPSLALLRFAFQTGLQTAATKARELRLRDSVGPIFFLAAHAGGGFDEAGFADAGAVLQGEIDTAAGVDIRATLSALIFAVFFARFYHFWLILGSALD